MFALILWIPNIFVVFTFYVSNFSGPVYYDEIFIFCTKIMVSTYNTVLLVTDQIESLAEGPHHTRLFCTQYCDIAIKR
jgi:hypothetical protein